MVLDSILLLMKYVKQISINSIDMMGAFLLIVIIFITYIMMIKQRDRAEDIHNLYMEMVYNVEKRQGKDNDKTK